MKKQEADSADDYTMWETIKDSVELDGGRMFTGSLQGDPNSHPTGIAFRRSLQLLKNTINEQWDGGKEKAQGLIVKMNNDMQKIESKYN